MAETEIKEEYFEPVKTQTDIAKCPSCGANMIFSAEKQVLKCEFCGTEQGFEMQKNAELEFSRLLEINSSWTDETKVFCCSNCGAKEVVSRSDIAKSCSFCGTSNIVETNELSGLKPNAVVPFKISKEDANKRAVVWARKRFFAPKKFKKSIDTEDINGVYNPAFTFDTDTLSVYSGRLGKRYTTTSRVNGKTVTQTHIRYFSISGTYSMFFDDILIQASSAIGQKTIQKLQPFNTNESSAYTKDFLHGYAATQYTKDGAACWNEAKKVIDKKVRSGILSKYDYDVVDSLTIRTDCRRITYKYLLLPIYVGHFNWRHKLYNFFVSGYNGKVTGKMPVSALKVLGVAGLGLLVAGGIIALILLSAAGII